MNNLLIFSLILVGTFVCANPPTNEDPSECVLILAQGTSFSFSPSNNNGEGHSPATKWGFSGVAMSPTGDRFAIAESRRLTTASQATHGRPIHTDSEYNLRYFFMPPHLEEAPKREPLSFPLPNEPSSEFDSEYGGHVSNIATCYSNNGELVAHSAWDGRVIIRNEKEREKAQISMGKPIALLVGDSESPTYRKKEVTGLFFSPNDTFLIESSTFRDAKEGESFSKNNSPQLKIWQVEFGTEVELDYPELVHEQHKLYFRHAFSKSEDTFVLADKNGIHVFDMRTRVRTHHYSMDYMPESLLFSDDNKLLWISGGKLQEWEIGTKSPVTLLDHGSLEHAELSADKSLLMTKARYSDGNIMIYEWPSLKPKLELRGEKPIYPFFTHNPNSPYRNLVTTYSASREGYRIHFRDMNTGQSVHNFEMSRLKTSYSESHQVFSRSQNGRVVSVLRESNVSGDTNSLQVFDVQRAIDSLEQSHETITRTEYDEASGNFTVFSKTESGLIRIRHYNYKS